jgi:hypothetical protein
MPPFRVSPLTQQQLPHELTFPLVIGGVSFACWWPTTKPGCPIQREMPNKTESAPTRHKFLRTQAVTWSGRIYLGTSPRRTSRNSPCSKPRAPSCAEE